MTIILTSLSTGGVLFIVFVYAFVFKPTEGEKIVALLSRLFAWMGSTYEKTATAAGIQAKIDNFILSINQEVVGLLPYYLKIKWVSPGIKRSAFIENDRVVVLLSRHQDQDVNLTAATALFMQRAVIPEARPHIDRKLSQAIDLMMTKKALFSFRHRAPSALDRFVRGYLTPKVTDDEDLKKYCTAIDQTDENGLFTRVILRELLELGRKRAGAMETGDTVFETRQFVDKVLELTDREPGVNIDLHFVRTNIRVAIVLVAKPENVALGPDRYIRAIESALERGVNTIYVFARSKSIPLAQTTVKTAKEGIPQLDLLCEDKFNVPFIQGDVDRNIETYCAIFHLSIP